MAKPPNLPKASKDVDSAAEGVHEAGLLTKMAPPRSISVIKGQGSPHLAKLHKSR